MRVHIEVERIVLHDIPLGQADRVRLLAAVEQAIGQQISTRESGWEAASVPVLTPSPVILPANGSGALATAIAGATVRALGHGGGGKS